MKFLYWITLWLGLVLAMTVAGAIAGSLIFLVVGHLAGMDYSTRELLLNGGRDGGFLTFLWAPGTSFIICIVMAHKRSRTSSPVDNQY